MKTDFTSAMVLSLIASAAMSLAGDQSPKPEPTPTPAPTVTPTPRPGTSPQSSSTDDRPRVGAPLKSQARKFNPSRVEPMPPGTEPASTAAPGESGQPVAKRPQGLRRQGKRGPHQEPSASATEPSASTPARSPRSTPNEGNDRRGHDVQTPSPTPTPADR